MSKLVDSKGNVILNLDKYVFGSAIANYGANDFLYCYIDFEKEIESMVISIMGNPGTPRDQISNHYIQHPYDNNPKRACVFIKGGGFVQGHLIKVHYIAKLKD